MNTKQKPMGGKRRLGRWDGQGKAEDRPPAAGRMLRLIKWSGKHLWTQGKLIAVHGWRLRETGETISPKFEVGDSPCLHPIIFGKHIIESC